MAAPQIPNLNSLRRGDGSSRIKDRTNITKEARKSNDQIVQGTDNDAAASRLSAVDAGYLDDPFAALLTDQTTQRRLPLMNRGTYVRTTGIDKIVDTFLSTYSGQVQIVSLGAGSDTRYFRLLRQGAHNDLIYHEIDFPSNASAKIARLKTASSQILRLCGMDLNFGKQIDDHFQCSNYHIHACDLRSLAEDRHLPGIEDIPTLLISECCLIYLAPTQADAVLEYFSKLFSASLAIAIYEPIRPHDSFGRTMVRNLISQGIHLQTLEKYADLREQTARLDAMAMHSRAADVEFVWRTWIDEHEKGRINDLEWMDEIEEFDLLARHYCISWGWRDFSSNAFKALPVP